MDGEQLEQGSGLATTQLPLTDGLAASADGEATDDRDAQ
jgi:hypothetical protein